MNQSSTLTDDTRTPRWYADWHRHLRQFGPRMSDAELHASARLATVLLCGEESAIRIFTAEIDRQKGEAYRDGLRELVRIEQEEHWHERALQAFTTYLPVPDDAHRLRRRAQRFFARLGRAEFMPRRFGQIALLDGAVCRIMHHVEHSSVASVSPLKLLASRIKRDEAGHVAVSRRYAAGLGLARSVQNEDRDHVMRGLAQLLLPLGDSFEAVGVDSDRLFAQLLQRIEP